MKIREGSRESKLAVKQAKMVIDSIKRNNPHIEIELITMKTTGDIILDQSLDTIGGKGLFVKELDVALLTRQVDITVHSYKDMPMDIDDRIPIVALSRREDPRDVLVLPKGMHEIDFRKPIGCSSLRRKVQFQLIYPNSIIEPIRGNVLTRLDKLDRGDYSAVILAYAGLTRLGLEERISRIFSTEEILPAACQGIIAVQARKDFDASILKSFNDEESWDISVAERSFIKALNGGCSSPAAAYGKIQGDQIILTGFHVGKNNRPYRMTKAGDRKRGETLGRDLAFEMMREMNT